ncbi:MAG: LLM class flavin-dependent oxidoreductase [Chloroflexi bacterium]|nr:LLM class flavin-dependent oxidoreductase [Chloroflexota bacterium]
MAVKLGISWIPDNPGEYPKRIRWAEATGFTLLGVPDTQASLYRDCYVCLTVAAVNSARARIGPLVSNPVTRHPAVTASAVASADEVSGGRAFLGIATGDSGVFNLGLRPASLQGMADYIQVLRGLWTGEEVTHEGHTMRLRWAHRRIPIYIAADGPRALRLAGQIADGVVIGSGISPEAISGSLAHVEEGAREAGRSLKNIDMWWMIRGSVSEDLQEALDAVKPTLAGSANHVFRSTMAGKGVPPDKAEPLLLLQQRYNVHYHNDVSPGNPNARLVDELGLTGYLLGRFGVVGTPEQCTTRIKEAEAAGATQLILRPMSRDMGRFMALWPKVAREVL